MLFILPSFLTYVAMQEIILYIMDALDIKKTSQMKSYLICLITYFYNIKFL